MLAINWGYALLVTGIGMGTVFLLLIILIWIINLQTKITDRLDLGNWFANQNHQWHHRPLERGF